MREFPPSAPDYSRTGERGSPKDLGNADMAPIIFSECPDQSGMHFNGQEFVAAEIIDPDTNEVLPLETGVTGELVYTSLERRMRAVAAISHPRSRHRDRHCLPLRAHQLQTAVHRTHR